MRGGDFILPCNVSLQRFITSEYKIPVTSTNYFTNDYPEQRSKADDVRTATYQAKIKITHTLTKLAGYVKLLKDQKIQTKVYMCCTTGSDRFFCKFVIGTYIAMSLCSRIRMAVVHP